ncbi:MAG: TnpV protein [Clostridia bacterium]|nr:TnpV protein [Clostridia bacterium]
MHEVPRQAIGRYGRMRLNYLREHRPGLYTRLILSGKLYEHLSEIDQTSRRRMEQIISQMAQAEGIDEKLNSATLRSVSGSQKHPARWGKVP